MNAGAERAAHRLYTHRVDQARRVAPALPALAEKRKAWAHRRAKRWDSCAWTFGFDRAPGHIKAKAREAGLA